MSKNVPPVAHKVMCVDFDGTLFGWGKLYESTDPFVGAVDFMRSAKDAGWEIIIFTSRMSPTWWASEGWDFQKAIVEQTAFIEKRLNDFGMPYDRITSEKVPAEYYIDDRALEFEGKTYSWKDIHKRVLGSP